MEKTHQATQDELDRAVAQLKQRELDQQASEARVRLLEEQLAAKNHELDASLEQVMHLVEEAERANRAQDQFLDNMSHELLTPLTGIVGSVSLLHSCDLEWDEEQAEYLMLIERSAEDLQTVIQGILDLANAKRGALELASVDFDLRLLLKEAFDALRGKARDKALAFTANIASDVPARVCGDPNAVRRVLMHLANNAIYFTQHGSVSVNVDVFAETENNVEVAVRIDDTGPGMTEEQTSLLFTLLEREEIAATSLGGGSGLGLLVANALAMRMSSKAIQVKSVLGVGSRFQFFVVLGKQHAQAANAPEGLPGDLPGDLHETAPTSVAVEDQRVMVVGPKSNGRQTICESLAAWQTDSAVFEGGKEAIAALRQAAVDGKPFHQVVVDPQLIGLSVDTFCKTIRDDATLAFTRTIVCASEGQAGDGERYTNVGAAAYLTQPVKPFRLYNCLQAVAAKPTVTRRKTPTQLVTRHTLGEKRRHSVCPLFICDPLTEELGIAALIERWGYAIKKVADPRQAVEALKASARYPMVIAELDLALDAAKRIRAPGSGCQNPRVPIIALTVLDDEGALSAARTAGVSEIVKAQAAGKELLNLIEKYALGSLPTPEAIPEAIPTMTVDPSPEGVSTGCHWQQMRDYLLGTFEGDEDLTTMVLDLFFDEDIPEVQVKLATAIAAENFEEVIREGHTLKGAAANVGAESLREIALDIENAGRAQNIAKAQARAGDFAEEFARLAQEKAAAAGA